MISNSKNKRKREEMIVKCEELITLEIFKQIKLVIDKCKLLIDDLFLNFTVERNYNDKTYIFINNKAYCEIIKLLKKYRMLNLSSLAKVFNKKINDYELNYYIMKNFSTIFSSEEADIKYGIYLFFVGIMNFFGLGVKQNIEYGEKCIFKSALIGDTFGLIFTSKIIYSNIITKNNLNILYQVLLTFKIIKDNVSIKKFYNYIINNKDYILYNIYKKILILNNTEALKFLGYCYQNEIGVKYNKVIANNFYNFHVHLNN